MDGIVGVGFVLFGALAVATLVVIQRAAHKARRAPFRQRATMSISDWCDKFYPGVTTEPIGVVLQAIADDLGIDPSQLRPDDELEQYWHGRFFMDPDDIQWQDIVDGTFEIDPAVGAECQTLDDVICAVLQSNVKEKQR